VSIEYSTVYTKTYIKPNPGSVLEVSEMSIRGSVKAIGTLLRFKDNASSINAIVGLTGYEANNTQTVKGINEVIVIPSLNAPIVLIYDKKSRVYRLA